MARHVQGHMCPRWQLCRAVTCYRKRTFAKHDMPARSQGHQLLFSHAASCVCVQNQNTRPAQSRGCTGAHRPSSQGVATVQMKNLQGSMTFTDQRSMCWLVKLEAGT